MEPRKRPQLGVRSLISSLPSRRIIAMLELTLLRRRGYGPCAWTRVRPAGKDLTSHRTSPLTPGGIHTATSTLAVTVPFPTSFAMLRRPLLKVGISRNDSKLRLFVATNPGEIDRALVGESDQPIAHYC